MVIDVDGVELVVISMIVGWVVVEVKFVRGRWGWNIVDVWKDIFGVFVDGGEGGGVFGVDVLVMVMVFVMFIIMVMRVIVIIMRVVVVRVRGVFVSYCFFFGFG